MHGGDTWDQCRRDVLGAIDRHEAVIAEVRETWAASNQVIRELLADQRVYFSGVVSHLEASTARLEVGQAQIWTEVTTLSARVRPLEVAGSEDSGRRSALYGLAEVGVKWMSLLVAAIALVVAVMK